MATHSSILAWRIPWTEEPGGLPSQRHDRVANTFTIPLRGPEGVPSLPGAPQDEAGLTRKFETSNVGGATCRTPPIPRSALEKDPRPGPLFKGNPVGYFSGLRNHFRW